MILCARRGTRQFGLEVLTDYRIRSMAAQYILQSFIPPVLCQWIPKHWSKLITWYLQILLITTPCPHGLQKPHYYKSFASDIDWGKDARQVETERAKCTRARKRLRATRADVLLNIAQLRFDLLAQHWINYMTRSPCSKDNNFKSKVSWLPASIFILKIELDIGQPLLVCRFTRWKTFVRNSWKLVITVVFCT